MRRPFHLDLGLAWERLPDDEVDDRGIELAGRVSVCGEWPPPWSRIPRA